MLKRLGIVTVALAVGACGGGSDGTPGGPSPIPTVTSLSIAPGTDLLKIRQSETFTLTATMSDGSNRSATGSWASDAVSVATVDANGRVTAVASGEATITADSQGRRATRRLRVVPDYEGRWSGDWRIAGCSGDGDWARFEFCREIPIGALDMLALTLTQNRDSVNGNVDFGGTPGPVQGSIAGDGQLTLTGTYTIALEGLTLELTVSEWQTVTTDNQRMTGRFTFTLRAAGLQGSAALQGELRVVAKTGSALSATPRSAWLRDALSNLRKRR